MKKHGTKSISILDNVIPHEKRPGDLSLIKYFLNRNNGFVVMSNTVKSDLLSIKPDAKFLFHEHPLYEHFGEKLDTVAVRKKLNIPENKKVLLFFGFIRKYKGLQLLLEALTKLDDSYYCIIAGEPYESFDEYNNYIKANNIADKVQLHIRYISDDEVAEFFSAADLCVLPYKSATQSGIVGICYNFDLPVVATDVGSLKEMIKPHKTGIIIDGYNVDLLCTAIETYFNKNMQTEFSNNIRAYKKTISWENLAKNIVEFSKNI